MNEQQTIPAEAEQRHVTTKYQAEQAYLYSVMKALLSYLESPLEEDQYRNLKGALLDYEEAVSAQHIDALKDPLEVGNVLWLMTRHLAN